MAMMTASIANGTWTKLSPTLQGTYMYQRVLNGWAMTLQRKPADTNSYQICCGGDSL